MRVSFFSIFDVVIPKNNPTILNPSLLIPSPHSVLCFHPGRLYIRCSFDLPCCNVCIREPHFVLMFFPLALPFSVRFSGVCILSAVSRDVVHYVGILVSKWGFCNLCQVSYFVPCFVGYVEIVFPRYVVEFCGEFRNVRDLHQTLCHLFFFLCVIYLLLFLYCLSYLLLRVLVFDKYFF